ncbi:MAG: c-type cytochrome, partial [Anaerolineales bacterium]
MQRITVASLRLLIALTLLTLTACATESERGPVAAVPGGDAARGQELLSAYGCTSCHVIPGIRGADATIGPPLTDWGERWYIAGLLINEPDNLMHFIQAPQSVKPGIAMPDMGVTTSDARDMAAYLYTLVDGGYSTAPVEGTPAGAPAAPPAAGTPSGTPTGTPT